MPLVNAGQRVTAAAESADYAQTDTATFPVTAATLTDITKGWVILGGDAAPGTAYRLTTGGTLVWGSTQQTLQFQTYFAGQTTPINDPQIGLTEFNVSAACRWSFQILLLCRTTGVSGTWAVITSGAISSVASTILSAGVGNNATIAFAGGTSTDITANSLVLETLKLQVAWGSTTGAPLITSKLSLFERLGG